MDTAASFILLLTIGNAALGSRAFATPMQGAKHGVRLRRGVLDGLAKTILNPLNLLGRRGGPGSSAHSDSVNVGATLPFGISAGISGSSSDAHSSSGDVASASSSSGGSGYPQAHGGSGSSASAGQSRASQATVPARYPGLVQSAGQPVLYAWDPAVRPSNGRITVDRGLEAAGDYFAEPQPPRTIVSGGIIDRESTAPKYTGHPNNWPTQPNDRASILTQSQYGGLLGDNNRKESSIKAEDVLLGVGNCGGDRNRCTSAREILSHVYKQGSRESDFIRGAHEDWKTAYGNNRNDNFENVVGAVRQLHDSGTPAAIITGTDRFIGDSYNPKTTSSGRAAEDTRNSVDHAVREVFGGRVIGASERQTPLVYI